MFMVAFAVIVVAVIVVVMNSNMLTFHRLKSKMINPPTNKSCENPAC